jgi:hypothetical protein
MKQIDGLCPKCEEWTTVTYEDNGCCDRGCYAEGSHYSSDKLTALVELAVGDQAALESKERRYFGTT